MIKKALVAVIMAGAVVPLAGVAGADPNPDGHLPCRGDCPDNGMPGTEYMVGYPPGYWSRAAAVSKDTRTALAAELGRRA
jgi:hypothetical protein